MVCEREEKEMVESKWKGRGKEDSEGMKRGEEEAYVTVLSLV